MTVVFFSFVGGNKTVFWILILWVNSYLERCSGRVLLVEVLQTTELGKTLQHNSTVTTRDYDWELVNVVIASDKSDNIGTDLF